MSVQFQGGPQIQQDVKKIWFRTGLKEHHRVAAALRTCSSHVLLEQNASGLKSKKTEN